MRRRARPEADRASIHPNMLQNLYPESKPRVAGERVGSPPRYYPSLLPLPLAGTLPSEFPFKYS
jgi:hypothetical protein